jgi:hypothetical protein
MCWKSVMQIKLQNKYLTTEYQAVSYLKDVRK